MARNRRRPLLLSLASLLGALSLFAQPPLDVTIVSEAGRRTIPVSEFSGQSMVALSAILDLVGAETRSATDSAVQVGVGGTVARLSDGMNFVPVGGRTVMLQSPPRRVSGQWFVPLDFLSRVLPSISPVRVTYRDRDRMLILGAGFPTLEVSTSRDPRYTRVEVVTNRDVPIELAQSSEEIRLTIQVPYLETAFRIEEVGDGVVERIQLERRPGHYELSVNLGAWFGRLDASEQRAPRHGVVLDLLRSNVPNAGARATGVDVVEAELRSMVEREAALAAERERAAAEAAALAGDVEGADPGPDAATDPDPDGGEEDSESDIEFETIELPPDFGLTNPDPLRPEAGRARSGPSELRIVAIDPGHGGTETGAEGASGLVEKDLVLDVARRLKTLLQQRLGVRVILTRDGDRDLDLDERPAIANNNKADLFISIHADASPRRDARGSSVYFLSYSADGRARGAAATGTGTGTGTGARAPRSDLDFILWELAQASHLNQSSQLAEIFQEELRAATNASGVNRGIKQNTFRVLKGATMPAVLVELGFISNPQEEALLGTEEHQEKLAEALYRGVVRFKDFFEYEPRASESESDSVSSRGRP